ncbi:alcohol dehydrogenase catalytic domain-containing protein [Halalkalibacter alkaliphilus]|uniref:Alcohol dehydrogenase catalytic domain-containing protein n=1 Tax=Halalkalibacter alkaliphilus TaxID=2917993 RepID=A0A9X2CWB6_9BACI|nr:alcohol dehydrogenase catalytic domain-containing protein [Halalkalibacter alkaliphilus]MCL7749517.1 alcohol dehydrogenase catalytic domain-containing protein [Halalkalibacter alkaliphilus]
MKALTKSEKAPGASMQTKVMPEPRANEVLVQVKITAICGTDIHIFNWNDWAAGLGIEQGNVMGHECVAEVVKLGEGVTSLSVGDRVCIETHIPCRDCRLCHNGNMHICENETIFSVHTNGCFADYAVVPAICARKVPESIPDEIASIMEPVGVGVHAAQIGDVKGKNVVVLGAGPIGLFSACASLALGAKQVTISDIKDTRLEVASLCGDFQLWNPLKTSAYSLFDTSASASGPEVIIETTGSNRAVSDILPYLRKKGTMVMVGLFPGDVSLNFSQDIIFKEVTIKGVHGRIMWDTWELMEKLIQNDKLNVQPAITHRFKLEEYEEAFRIAASGEGTKVLLRP